MDYEEKKIDEEKNIFDIIQEEDDKMLNLLIEDDYIIRFYSSKLCSKINNTGKNDEIIINFKEKKKDEKIYIEIEIDLGPMCFSCNCVSYSDIYKIAKFPKRISVDKYEFFKRMYKNSKHHIVKIESNNVFVYRKNNIALEKPTPFFRRILNKFFLKKNI